MSLTNETVSENTQNSHFIKKCSIFDKKVGKKLIDSILEVVEGFENDSSIENLNKKTIKVDGETKTIDLDSIKNLTVSDKFQCCTCNITFIDREEQIDHYKCDLHLFNIKQKLAGKSIVDADEFEKLSDISSISGSDSEDDIYSSQSSLSDDDDDENAAKSYVQIARNKPKISFKLNDSTVLVMLRCILHGKKNIPENQQSLLNNVKSISPEDKWCIILVAAGHFAAAIFKGDQPIVHKTFHRYVVRAKRGTVQSQHDKSSFAKSAGACIRRQQESSFKEDMRNLIGQEWKSEIETCKCIFIRVPQYNRGVLISTNAASQINTPFDKNDPRLRSIPFMTFRPTFNEVKRTHTLLSKIENYSLSYIEYCSKLDKDKEPKVVKKSKIKSPKPKNQKSEKIQETVQDDLKIEEAKIESESFSDEQEEDVLTNPNPKTTNDDFIQSLKGDELKLFNEIYTTCLTNNPSKLSLVMDEFINSNNSQINEKILLLKNLLNKRLDQENGFTLLHLTSQLGNFECIWHLLLNGANPEIRDLTKYHRLPYFLSINKQTRNQYRRFANDYPDRYNYESAKISDPLSIEKLNEKQQKDKERKKKKNKIKKQKESQIKQKIAQEEIELNERKKFLELTDQEKKKLILDRNFLNLLPLENKKTENIQPQDQKFSTDEFKVISRCWYCGIDNSSQVPFEYFDYKFCSTKCLKSHREQQKTPKK